MPKAPFFCLTWMTKQLKFKHLFIFILKVCSIEKHKGWNFILICLHFGACAVNLDSWNNIRLFMLTYFLHYALFCHLKNNAEIKWLGFSYYILEVFKEVWIYHWIEILSKQFFEKWCKEKVFSNRIPIKLFCENNKFCITLNKFKAT